MAFDSSEQLLYGVLEASPGLAGRVLFSVDPLEPNLIVRGNLSDTLNISALSFDGLGQLYLVDTNGQSLLRIDANTGTTLESIPLSSPVGSIGGMDFVPELGRFIFAESTLGEGGSGRMMSIDPQSGEVDIIGQVDPPWGLTGIAYVPEPSSFFLLMACLSICDAYVSRRRDMRSSGS